MTHPVRLLALGISAGAVVALHAQQAQRVERPSGTIKVYNLIGTLQVSASAGDVESLSVDTGSGDVEVAAPRSLGAAVEIETSSGDITTDFPLQVTRTGRDGLWGTIGSGKGRISIDTASGDVALKQQP